MLLDASDQDWQWIEEMAAEQRRIDIWYQQGNSGALMLLLAHLMMRSPFWEKAELRVLTVVQAEDPEATAEALRLELEQGRIAAKAVVVEDCTSATISRYSADASLVFLPLTLKAGQIIDCTGGAVGSLLSKLPLVALVVAAQQITLDAEPVEGSAGLLAAAEDALAAAEDRLRMTEDEVLAANESIEENLKGLLDARQQGSAEEVTRIYEELAKARQQLDKATRRSAKAEAKLEGEKQQLEQLRKQYHLTEDPEDEPDEKPV